MSEETKTETTQTEETKSGKVVFESQEDFDAVLTRRLAKEREKYKDYDSLKSDLDKLIQEKKERENEELSEVEKLKKQLEEKDNQIADLKIHKDWRDGWERREAEKIDKAMADLSDEDKELVNDLPLEKRMIMVNKLKSEDVKHPQTGKFVKGERVPTTEEYMGIRAQYGPQSPEAVHARNLINEHRKGA